jgi:hypothetical protein
MTTTTYMIDESDDDQSTICKLILKTKKGNPNIGPNIIRLIELEWLERIEQISKLSKSFIGQR